MNSPDALFKESLFEMLKGNPVQEDMLGVITTFKTRAPFAVDDLEEMLGVGNKFPFLWAEYKKHCPGDLTSIDDVKRAHQYFQNLQYDEVQEIVCVPSFLDAIREREL